MKKQKYLCFKRILLLLVLLCCFSTVLYLNGCTPAPRNDFEFRTEKQEIMLNYMQERYNENFEVIEQKIAESGGSLILGDVRKSWMYGLELRNENDDIISVTINWDQYSKPKTVICYDDYLNVKYLPELEEQLKTLREGIFGKFNGTGVSGFGDLFLRPDVKQLSKLSGFVDKDDYVAYYATLSKENFSNNNVKIRFRAEFPPINWEYTEKDQLAKLENYKEGLKVLRCPLGYSVVYQPYSTQISYIGYFAIDDNWEYSKFEIKSKWEVDNNK